jgi:hypothetical protein
MSPIPPQHRAYDRGAGGEAHGQQREPPRCGTGTRQGWDDARDPVSRAKPIERKQRGQGRLYMATRILATSVRVRLDRGHDAYGEELKPAPKRRKAARNASARG